MEEKETLLELFKRFLSENNIIIEEYEQYNGEEMYCGSNFYITRTTDNSVITIEDLV